MITVTPCPDSQGLAEVLTRLIETLLIIIDVNSILCIGPFAASIDIVGLLLAVLVS